MNDIVLVILSFSLNIKLRPTPIYTKQFTVKTAHPYLFIIERENANINEIGHFSTIKRKDKDNKRIEVGR